ncbi:MAG: type II secretion system protein [Minisyncoccia bacterium]
MEPIHFHRGFSLIELMVVLAIIITITGVVLTNQSSFNKSLILANTAYDVALSVRNAQTFGLSSRVISTATNVGYGVNFDRATPNKFTLFTDTYPLPGAVSNCHPVSDPTAPNARPGDCAYESNQSEKVTEYVLGNNITITDICAYSSSSWSCSSSNGGNLSTLDIVFARPNSDAFMSKNGVYSSSFPVTAACIVLSSAQGGARYVAVGLSGQITADAASCP